MPRIAPNVTHGQWGLGTTPDEQEWMGRAACTSLDPESFVVAKSHLGLNATNRAALACCWHCPVLAECAAWADEVDRRLANIDAPRVDVHRAWIGMIVGGRVYNRSGRPRAVQPPRPARQAPTDGRLSARQVARLRHCTVDTVWSAAISGRLPAVKDARGRWRIHPQDADEWRPLRHRPHRDRVGAVA